MPRKRKTYDYGTRNLVGEYGYENKKNTVVKNNKKMGKTSYKNNYKRSKKDYKFINLEKKVKAMETAKEKKHLETVVTSSPVPAGVMQMITNMIQGTDEDDRIGSKVKMYSIQFSGHIHHVQDKGHSVGRIIIFIDHDQNGILPTIIGMWDSVADFTAGKPRNKISGLSESFKRFTIIYDYQYVSNPAGGGVGISFNSADTLTTTLFRVGSRSILKSFYTKLYHYISYKGSDSVAASQGDGSMYVFSTNEIATTTLVDASIMIKYTDD